MELINLDHAQECSFDMSLLKPSFETGKSNVDLNALFEKYEFEFQQKLSQEYQKLRELIISERDSCTTQLMEFQETTRIMKHEIGQLRQDMNDNLATTIERTIGQIFRHHRGLDKDLGKCCIQLESATQDVHRLALERDTLDTDPRQCRIQLESATQAVGAHIASIRECRIQIESAAQAVDSKTRESDQLKAHKASMEAANKTQLQRLDKIQQEHCKEKERHHGSYIDGSQTSYVWESAAKKMFFSIGMFNNLLSKYKDSEGNKPARALIADGELGIKVRVARPNHWIFLLKTFICSGLFQDFEYETFLMSNNRVLFLDQDERVREYFEYFQKSRNEGSADRATAPRATGAFLDFLFCRYCRGQIRLLPPAVHHLGSACRDYDELMATVRTKKHESGIHANEGRLFNSFITAAKKAWDFHKLCLSFNPPATIFRVSPGDPLNADYMESIDTEDDYNFPLVGGLVGCMIYPGFRLQKSIIKCQVYPLRKT